MVTGILFTLVAILCLWGAITQAKQRNFFGVGYSIVSLAVFGWFGVMTTWDALGGGGINIGH